MSLTPAEACQKYGHAPTLKDKLRLSKAIDTIPPSDYTYECQFCGEIIHHTEKEEVQK